MEQIQNSNSRQNFSSFIGLQGRLIGVLLVLALLVLTVGISSLVGLRKITQTSEKTTKQELSVTRTVEESLLSLSTAQTNLEAALDVGNYSDVDTINKYESRFLGSINKFSMFNAALTWGTENGAFSKSDGGINAYEWEKMGLKGDIVMSPPSSEQRENAGIAGIYFTGFSNYGQKAIGTYKKYLRLASAGKNKEAKEAKAEATGYLLKSRRYFRDTNEALSGIVASSQGNIESSIALINSTYLFSQRMLAVSFGIMIIAVFLSIVYTRSAVTKPLGELVYGTKKFQDGELDYRIMLNTHDEMELLATSLNGMAQKLKESEVSWKEKLEENTSELTNKLTELENTKIAMVNLLDDARHLEAELKREKEGVQKKVEERTKELAEEQARLHASINSLTLGFIMTDTHDNIVVMNEAAGRILHVNKEHKTIHEIQKELQGRLDIVSQIVVCLSTKHAVELKDIAFGNQFLHVYIAPILLEKQGSEVIGVVTLLEDITDAKILQRSRDEFFSIASHELRTPLTAIRGNTSLIQKYYTEDLKDPELKEMINDIHKSSVRLIDIVNDFLDTSRLELGKMVFKKDAFAITPLVQEVIKEYITTGSMRKLYLRMDETTEQFPEVVADRDRLKQVLINLVGNSLKFTEEGGVSISLKREGDFVRIFVTDTGKGIPFENQPLLFRKFQQAGNSIFTRDSTRGTGLGLYISRMMMGGMGGSIQLDHSEPNKGTTFSIQIPIAKNQTTTASAPQGVVQPPQSLVN